MRWSIILLMSLSLACSKKDSTAPADPEQAAEGEAPAAEGSKPTAEPEVDPAVALDPPEALKAGTPAVGAPPTLDVLEQGQEPRKALRWNVEPGFEQKVSTVVGFAVEAAVVVMIVSSPEYVVSFDLTMRAKKVEDDRTVRVAFKVDGATNEMKGGQKERRVKALKAALAPVRKVTGSYTLSPQGHITDLELKVPRGAKRDSHDMVDNLRWALSQMTPTFPEEPLGQGAKWTVHQGVEQGGIHVNQLTTIEIVKVEGNRVELAIDVQQGADKQLFKNPGTGLELNLTALNGTASGSLTWDLTELAPRAANMDGKVAKGVVQDHPSDPTKGRTGMLVESSRTAKITEK